MKIYIALITHNIIRLLHYVNKVTRAMHGWSTLKGHLQRIPQHTRKEPLPEQADLIGKAMRGDIILYVLLLQ
jgi:hypothetical protein